MQINLGDARDKLSELVKAVLDGQQVTICKQGEPVVDLIRTQTPKRIPPKFGTLRDKIKIHDPHWADGLKTVEDLENWLEGKL